MLLNCLVTMHILIHGIDMISKDDIDLVKIVRAMCIAKCGWQGEADETDHKIFLEAADYVWDCGRRFKYEEEIKRRQKELDEMREYLEQKKEDKSS
jgi:hypothetical protein